jgi:very-short-patch-repair endonuclease
MRSRLTDVAKGLRKTSTDAERVLWRSLRARQVEGLKFRRQQPIGRYVVDFVCLERSVVVEIDGGQHAGAEQREKDKTRDQWLVDEGFTVLRFWDNEVLSNREGVLEVIRKACLTTLP